MPIPSMNALPEPSAAQIDLSRSLERLLRARIAAAGGALPFDQYMEAALYAPGLGYYVAGQQRFGAAGDFVTGPELTPLFGFCLAAQLQQWFENCPPVVWEFGAGSGELAAQICGALHRAGLEDLRYRIVELSPDLRERQRERLARRLPREVFERVDWLDQLPERIEGVVLANELLDAMPVKVFELTESGVAECVVIDRDGLLGWTLRAADPALERAVLARLSASGWARTAFASGYRSELAEQTSAWLASVGERLVRGAILLIDYGFPCHEYYHPQRGCGTLNCHYRHRSHADPFWRPGLCDITAHVDFSLLAQTGASVGLDLLGYTSQANFLLACGLAEQLAAVADADALGRARAAQAAQILVSEAEMGELFKVIALGRGLADDAIGFARRDRRAVLDLPAP
jgi:SAM-dependent MidA family methyltransferase